jgi:hypothetical protein
VSLADPLTVADYAPATVASDRRVCRVCAAKHEVAIWFPICNTRTGKYHSGGEWGVTDCGHDATSDHWLWPL